MSAEGQTAPPSPGQHTPNHRNRRDSISPGGTQYKQRTHDQQGSIMQKQGRGRSGTIAAAPSINLSEAEPKADGNDVQHAQDSIAEAIEEDKESDTFEDAPDTNGGEAPSVEGATQNQVEDHSDNMSQKAHEDVKGQEDLEDAAGPEHDEHAAEQNVHGQPVLEEHAGVADASASNKRSSMASTKRASIISTKESLKSVATGHTNTTLAVDDAATDRYSLATMDIPADNHILTDSDIPVDNESILDVDTSSSNNAGEEAQESEAQEKKASAHKPHISTATMSSVSLGDDSEQTPTQGKALPSAPDLPPAVPPRDNAQSSEEPVKGLSGDLPSVNYPPPPPPPESAKPFIPPPPTRKVSSPFAWFSRATSRKPTSPTRATATAETTNRRNTASSMATLGSNPETEDAQERSGGRSRGSSLKDRFHYLRLQEEAAAPSEDSVDGTSRVRSGSMQNASGDEKERLGPPTTSRSNSFSTAPSPTTAKLAPGTASGYSAGPSEEAVAVNWDLWQSVVYEGPAAVARTSGEELNSAIASGIPQPIRGVVWQVLADSKNTDLEAMYNELIVRGTEKDTGRPPLMPRTTSAANTNAPEKEPLASSASSIKSEGSAPATALSRVTSNENHTPDTATAVAQKRRSGDDKAAIQKLEKTIKRDLGARTSYSKYLVSAGLQDGLFGVCKAYALFDDQVGYAQGMNFIVMPLLFNMPEEEAFTLFVRLMSKYNMRSMFTPEMTGLHLHLYQFERLLEDFEPALYCHLHRRGVAPNLYATQWFLTLFAYRFPLQLVLRVYDLILSEGLSAVLKFGICLMQKNAQTLLGMKDMSQLSVYLKERLFDVYIDKSPSASSILESGFFGSAGGIDKEVYRADELVRDACAVKIAPETLAAYAAEYTETQRVEKEREEELEKLSSSNSKMTVRVRNLEERVQQQDTEHVSIASELVRTKVENEALEDDNEGLKTQVAELRKMVEVQPAEVEERLRAEMERIMQRNIEVQNENRALEDSVQEMEQELVGTKMMFAQLNAEHDTLKQKLAAIQTMLNENK